MGGGDKFRVLTGPPQIMPSHRDFEQNHRKANAEGNSSRHAKRISGLVVWE